MANHDRKGIRLVHEDLTHLINDIKKERDNLTPSEIAELAPLIDELLCALPAEETGEVSRET